MEEKTAIGFFLSGHPFNSSAPEVRRFIRTPLSNIGPKREPQMLAGVVTATRIKMGNRGKMAFVTLDDGSGTPLDVTVYSEVLDAAKGKINQDEVLIVEGKVSEDQFSGGLRIIAERLITLGEARGRYARLLRLSVKAEAFRTPQGAPASAARLLELLAGYRASREDGACPIRVRYHNGKAEGDLPLGEDWRVKLEDPLLETLREWFSPEGVEIVYQ